MNAIQTEVSDGTLQVIQVGLEFFRQADIHVRLNDLSEPLVLGTDYTWSAASTITLLGGPVAAGGVITLQRTTQSDEMYNIYDGGAPFSRLALDENFLQLLRLAQEFTEGLGLTQLRQDLDMHGNRIIHVRDPANPQDAATKSYVDVKDALEALTRATSDAALQTQISTGTSSVASPFSAISWHPQVVEVGVNIPDGVNAWSFGPTMTIASGQIVTIGEDSFWTIANGEVQE